MNVTLSEVEALIIVYPSTHHKWSDIARERLQRLKKLNRPLRH